MAGLIGKFVGGVGQAASNIGSVQQQNDLAMQRDEKLAKMKEEILEARNAKLQQLGTAGQREREDLWKELEGGTDESGNLMPWENLTARQKAAAVKLRIAPAPTGSGALTIAEQGKTDIVAGSQEDIERGKKRGAEFGKTEGMRESDRAGLEGSIAESREQATSDVQLKMRPKIQAAIKEAEATAKSKGETLNDYRIAQAALPGLQEVVGKLKTLSDVATYTMTGRAFDTLSKELGFGATEGGTARAKMESLVDNQILPLLRDTFGAQFTEKEGERLRRTMLDIDAAPEQKKAILDSFLEQKMRDLEAKQGELGISVEKGQAGTSSWSADKQFQSLEEEDAALDDYLKSKGIDL